MKDPQDPGTIELKLRQTKSNAEIQAGYRKRRQGANDARLNTWITLDAKVELKALARHYGVTDRAILEKLITEKADQITSPMSEKEIDRYYCSKPGTK